MFQFILEVLSGVEVMCLYRLTRFFTISSLNLHYAQGHCHAGAGIKLSLLVSFKGNLKVKSYKDILDTCVLSTLWKQCGEDLQMDVMVRCPHTSYYVTQSPLEKCLAVII